MNTRVIRIALRPDKDAAPLHWSQQARIAGRVEGPYSYGVHGIAAVSDLFGKRIATLKAQNRFQSGKILSMIAFSGLLTQKNASFGDQTQAEHKAACFQLKLREIGDFPPVTVSHYASNP
ncbi:MAG: hypothetical protein AAFX89_07915 [Pseudomonadota bacterium]